MCVAIQPIKTHFTATTEATTMCPEYLPGRPQTIFSLIFAPFMLGMCTLDLSGKVHYFDTVFPVHIGTCLISPWPVMITPKVVTHRRKPPNILTWSYSALLAKKVLSSVFLENDYCGGSHVRYAKF